MGAASLYEDIRRRRDEALSQLNSAFEKKRGAPNELDRLERNIELALKHAFRSLEEVLDVITDPDFDAAQDLLDTQRRNIKLSGELHSAKSEIARLERELSVAAENEKRLERERRDLAHKLHDEQQRVKAEKRRRR